MSSPAYTVSEVGKRFGLSRSTLLYYDRIGLLRPSGRSEANYRLYSRADIDRLQLIHTYRQAGLPLREIGDLLAEGGRGGQLLARLEKRLAQLNREIRLLRQQQQLIVTLMKNRSMLRASRCLDKKRWTAILRAAGMSDGDMHRWHVEFERAAPEAHQDFLEALGIEDREIERIRRWSRSEQS